MYQPNFTITNSILQNIGAIEAAKALIDSSPLLPSWEKRFQDDAVARTVHHGTHLEGNELEFSQAKRVIEGEKIAARDRDIKEVINYRNVIKFIGEKKRKIDENLIKTLHKLTINNIIQSDEIGAYRSKNVVIRNSRTNQITFRPPKAVEVENLMRDFILWINETGNNIHPVLKSAIAHYELVRIHPFIDGNGRVARALSTLILYNENCDIRRFFSLEEYYDKDAQAYYNALQSVSSPGTLNLEPRTSPRRGDLTPWLEYFTKGLAIEFNRVKEKIARISRDLKFQHSLGRQIYLNDRQLKLIEHIQEYGSLQNKQFSLIFPDLSDDTILRELNSLIKKGIIKKSGKTKASRYVLV